MSSPVQDRRQQALGYLVAVLVTALAGEVTQVLRPLVAPSVTPPFILAVAIAALFGGIGPGALASLLSALALSYWFFPPLHLDNPSDLARLILFLVVAIVITGIAGAAHRHRSRADAQALESERLRRLAEQLAARAEEATRQVRQSMTDETDSREAMARLAAIVSSSSDAIIGKTLDGVITSWNAAAERIFGYPTSEMVGQSVFKLIPEELHESERGVLAQLRRGESVELSETERIRKDGKRIWISLSVSPIRDATGVITGAASIKRDVTESRLMRQHLHDTQRFQAVGQLAGGIAHEANNQMTVVLGACAVSPPPARPGPICPGGHRIDPPGGRANRVDHPAAAGLQSPPGAGASGCRPEPRRADHRAGAAPIAGGEPRTDRAAPAAGRGGPRRPATTGTGAAEPDAECARCHAGAVGASPSRRTAWSSRREDAGR